MDRSELNEKAKKYIADSGLSMLTFTAHAVKCLMVDFYLDISAASTLDETNDIDAVGDKTQKS